MIEHTYNDLIESVKNISSFKYEIQKSVAVCMWNYVKEHLDELHDNLTDEEIDSGEKDYGYDVLESIKEDFCRQFKIDTGLVIDWENLCILCGYYTMIYDISDRYDRCDFCPLKSCSEHSDNPYHTLVKYALHTASRNEALSAIDTIIKAIKEAEL